MRLCPSSRIWGCSLHGYDVCMCFLRRLSEDTPYAQTDLIHSVTFIKLLTSTVQTRRK